MCIIAPNVQVADEDILVWKVFFVGKSTISSPFHGYGIHFSDMIARDAIGFENGFGFTCFVTEEDAIEYRKCLEGDFNTKLTIKNLIIPEGSKYACGEIVQGYYGEGMRAVRCERLREIT